MATPLAQVFYADSSVLVKRHVPEIGSNWFHSLSDPATGNLIVTSRLSYVEAFSALNRRRRENSVSPADYARLAADFAHVASTEYQIVELLASMAQRARHLLEQHPLRAGDAVQLASALEVADLLRPLTVAPLIFLASDDRLLNAARGEGLATDDPRLHP